MQYFAIVIWLRGYIPVVEPPAVICRAWTPAELAPLPPDEMEMEEGFFERGWRVCDCFSRYVRAGEFGRIHVNRLYEMPAWEFERGLALLRSNDLPDYEEWA